LRESHVFRLLVGGLELRCLLGWECLRVFQGVPSSVLVPSQVYRLPIAYVV
jgi:hypothetical protein